MYRVGHLLIARSSDWIDGGRKFESHNPGRGLGAPASAKFYLIGLESLTILVRPSPTSSLHVHSSESQVVGEGEYKTDTDRLRETIRETMGKRAGARSDYCKQVKLSVTKLAFGSRRNCWTKQLRRCSLSRGSQRLVFSVIIIVHGSGAFGVNNLTILRRSNGLSQEDHQILSTPR